MMTIKIVTDSTADLPKSLLEELGIQIVPLKIHFGEESYLDSITLTSDQFYEKLASSDRLPTTSQPSPIDFTDVYERIAQEGGTQILSIHLSGSLSGTVQTASIAAGMVEDKVRVHVLDSKIAAYPLGMVVIAAARAAREGKSLAACIEAAEKAISTQRAFFVVDTLTYLQKGGRIGKASALVGSLLNVKPILTIDETGTVAPVEKIRGKKKAVARILEMAKEYAGDNPVVAAAIYSTGEEEARVLAEEVGSQLNVVEPVAIGQLGPVIGTYGGPGLLAVSLYKIE
ncbi:DegV family protein [Aneurinibacillus sp. Ricciae_BoGa-3]|uniref:DegV family protein n=1 Tax=Aneurinibacillus sp. Ricciae_BoGa-3 TaxID=3022697 RepID=UPI0023419721|nr:DegV family protein [Aneurinibacillus sp. Ricciae_BoGa-3]WCK53029.1 DegV family protein [Aneurinibacillus sp. Ricciae_BoGa-3]